jgi:hypothetical protein
MTTRGESSSSPAVREGSKLFCCIEGVRNNEGKRCNRIGLTPMQSGWFLELTPVAVEYAVADV